MGANHSREDLDLSDADSDSDTESDSQTPEVHHHEEEDSFEDAKATSPSDPKTPKTPSSLDQVESKLKALKLKYSKSEPAPRNAVKLYLHAGGLTSNSKWVVADKCAAYSFVKTQNPDDSNDQEEAENEENSWWVLRIGSKIRVRIDQNLQLKAVKDQRRIDFAANGVWAAKFFSEEEYSSFFHKFQEYLFENTYGCQANDDNKVKVYGKDFIGWAKPEKADDSM